MGDKYVPSLKIKQKWTMRIWSYLAEKSYIKDTIGLWEKKAIKCPDKVAEKIRHTYCHQVEGKNKTWA